MTSRIQEIALNNTDIQRLLAKGVIKFAPPLTPAQIREAELEKRMDGMRRKNGHKSMEERWHDATHKEP